MSWPNLVAVLRLPLALIASAALIHDLPHAGWIVAVCTLLAIVTDWLDGWLARRLDDVTVFGAMLDLTMDKVFVCPVLFLLGDGDPVVLWCAVFILLRELLVMGVRVYAVTIDLVLPARPLGKWKTALVFLAILLLSVGPVVGVPFGAPVLVVGAGLAAVSGAEYSLAAFRAAAAR